MDYNKALELWRDEIGDKEYSYDFSGKKIKRDDYNVKNEVGWVVGYVRPLELGGNESKGNIMIMHHRTLDEKGLNYPDFNIGHSRYTCLYDPKYDYYYIEEVLDDEDD